MSADHGPLRVLVAGGGVAGAEALLALHALAGDRVAATLLTPDPKLIDRPASVRTPFGLGAPRALDLRAIAEHAGADVVQDSLAAVEPDRHRAIARDGRELDYDVLVVAVGAQASSPLPGALAFGGPAEAEAFRMVLHDLHVGVAQHVAFAVPGGATWPLPLYELALGTAARLRTLGVATTHVTLTTPEDAPLGLFGNAASDQVRALLDEARVELIPRSRPRAVEGNELVLVPERRIRADRVVTLPQLTGPRIPGLPHNAEGFLEVELDGQLRDVPDVYAAGDATAFPIKQGGLAAQQADALAHAIARRAGAAVDPLPFHPVLRGKLLVGRGSRFMESPIHGAAGDVSEFERVPLWWPPVKVAARHLGAYLEARNGRIAAAEKPDGVPVTATG